MLIAGFAAPILGLLVSSVFKRHIPSVFDAEQGEFCSVKFAEVKDVKHLNQVGPAGFAMDIKRLIGRSCAPDWVSIGASVGAGYFSGRLSDLSNPPPAEWLKELQAKTTRDIVKTDIKDLDQVLCSHRWTVVQRGKNRQVIADAAKRMRNRYEVSEHEFLDSKNGTFYAALIGGLDLDQAQRLQTALNETGTSCEVVHGIAGVVEVAPVPAANTKSGRHNSAAQSVPLTRSGLVLPYTDKQGRQVKGLPVHDRPSIVRKPIDSILRDRVCNVLGPPVGAEDGFSEFTWYEVSCNDISGRPTHGFVRSDQVRILDSLHAAESHPRPSDGVASLSKKTPEVAAPAVGVSTTRDSVTPRNTLMRPSFLDDKDLPPRR